MSENNSVLSNFGSSFFSACVFCSVYFVVCVFKCKLMCQFKALFSFGVVFLDVFVYMRECVFGVRCSQPLWESKMKQKSGRNICHKLFEIFWFLGPYESIVQFYFYFRIVFFRIIEFVPEIVFFLYFSFYFKFSNKNFKKGNWTF